MQVEFLNLMYHLQRYFRTDALQANVFQNQEAESDSLDAGHFLQKFMHQLNDYTTFYFLLFRCVFYDFCHVLNTVCSLVNKDAL